VSTIDDTYPLDIAERCLKWTQQDEGKIFWRWLRSEFDHVANSEGFVGAWEMEKIISANKMLAKAEQTALIEEFPKMLKSLITEKKAKGADLVALDEITD
jgi:hypothetical protein